MMLICYVFCYRYTTRKRNGERSSIWATTGHTRRRGSCTTTDTTTTTTTTSSSRARSSSTGTRSRRRSARDPSDRL
ncbi:unnamed protein product [Leptidea sinapis]|uniref:Uncharacterized protein n=1 Tax=Leptidea sinapis TaxID=189913 RepID=A0A5E4QQ88_9NEOP|nr:unnamed protein product [Leptidea sinapis]